MNSQLNNQPAKPSAQTARKSATSTKNHGLTMKASRKAAPALLTISMG